MAEAINSELEEALLGAGATPKAARVAARATARADTMEKVIIWMKSMMAMGGLLIAINGVMLAQMFTLTAQVAENKANITALTERVGKLEEGQEEIKRNQGEIISLLQARLSKNDAEQPGGKIPEISAAPPVRSLPPAAASPPTP